MVALLLSSLLSKHHW